MFMRTSIRYRLMLLMICLTTIPVLIVTLTATHNTRSSVEKEIIDANRSRMLWAQQYLDELVERIDVLFYSLQINQTLMDGLNPTGNPSVGEQFRTQRYIQETLTSAFYANSRKVDELSLYTHQNQRLYSVNFSTSGLIHSLHIENGAWSRMTAGPVNLYFKQTGDSVSAFHSVNRFEDRALLGGLSVRINDGVWKQVGDILRSESDSAVFLMNDEGELLTGSSSAAEYDAVLDTYRRTYEEDAAGFRKTDRYFLFAEQVDDGALTLLKAVPISAVTESANDTVRAGVALGLIFAGLSVLASILVSLRISRPIVSLAKTMRTAPIRHFEMTSVNSRDEIGLLERGYNSMIQRIRELIEHEYQREIEVKNAQLMALQAQINPHFLNNALLMIGGMALSKGAPDIYRVAKGIGDLLRYSIGSGAETASLGDEVRHARNYLLIQEQRFLGRCRVSFVVEEPTPRLLVPRFALQPLIENAFEHGLQPKEGAWEIDIRIRTVGRRIAVLIRDNGVGIDAARLRELREELRTGVSLQLPARSVEERGEPPRRKGIGLRNVNARLRLHFGAGAGIRMFSEPGAGTVIALALPMNGEGEETYS
ncbi:sensor histidine kinase [Paenibacillus antri]|uniref:histidine kinase n=1 Tax=Paenibacillus antri TaxID=2582848 RepID=A0A5R9G986_9BACL|nr:sensor histidine kinase [Paenibacillus antri]TLS51639.1 sensor histidine kinase [Paenibacillus antri]